jgi:hypothetical protein
MEVNKRPVSVTVIAWIIIVTSAIALATAPISSRMPEVQEFYEATGVSLAGVLIWSVAVNVIVLVSGISILKGRNWGRLVYLCFMPVSMVVSMILFGFRAIFILSVIYYIVVLVLLTRPAASAFFRGGPAVGVEKREKKVIWRKFASVVMLCVGGFFIMGLFVPFMFMFERNEFAISGLVLFIFVGLATPFMVAGVGLWGWGRWRIVLGVALTVIGAELAVGAMIMPLVMLSAEWEVFAKADTYSFMQPMFKSSALFGALLLVIGIFLIFRQRERDKRLPA